MKEARVAEENNSRSGAHALRLVSPSAVEKKRVLFVDDEPNILEGLKDLLRRHRRKWDMVFVGGGQEAIDELARSKFDVLVSDMRMPGVDGATLLRHAQEHHPETVRIVLSGYTELEAALRAVLVAQQFLTKPCKPDELENVVERASQLQTLIGDSVVRQLIGRIQKLPSLPQTYASLLQVLGDEKSGVADVARVLEQDMAMCAKLLQLVNSAFFGLGREITSIEHAVVFLGFSMVRNLVLTVEVFEGHRLPRISGFSFSGLERHAQLAAAIATRMMPNKRTAEDAFVAAILHDIGKLVLAAELPEEFEMAVAQAAPNAHPLHVAERQLHGITHAEVGAYLLGVWGLPYSVVEAVANHHAPTRVPQRGLDTLTAVYLANTLAHEQEQRAGIGTPFEPIDEAYVSSLGLTEKLPGWRAMAEERMNAVQLEGERFQALNTK
jgi:putative nucleotidyltransferase with HDIG domain